MLRGGLGRPRRLTSSFSSVGAPTNTPVETGEICAGWVSWRGCGGKEESRAMRWSRVAVGLKVSIWPMSPVVHDVLPAVKRSLFLISA